MPDSLNSVGLASINALLLVILVVITVAIIRLRSLFAIVLLSGVYSLVCAIWFVVLDAVDVAFTEAAVGAGVSTVLMLGAMLLTARTAKANPRWMSLGPTLITLSVGAMLIYASIDLPSFGDIASPVNSGVGDVILKQHYGDMGFPNVVTSILSSYRGFDTFGEVAVVFSAALSVTLLLGFGERSLSDEQSVAGEEDE